ncbi:MAG: DNA polymerase III subunit alpha [Mycoplasma sp.]|nr:DNA polymerase III subunit alpha [Mycoplasma sp.]
MNKFTNLHIMTEYSLLESSIKIDKLIDFAKKNNLKTITMTDRNNMYGAAEFYEKAIKNELKPIIGVDINIERYRFILLAKNYDGFLHISNLTSIKNDSNKTLTIDMIENENIFVIDHPNDGYFKIESKSLNIKNYFIGSISNEVKNGVFLPEVRALDESGAIALNLLKSIKDSSPIENNQNLENIIKINAPDEIDDSLIKNTILIENECNLIFEEAKMLLPSFDKKIESWKLLRENVFERLKKLNLDNNQKYIDRVEYELNVIKNMKFDDYFLLISDFIKWAKSKQISIGPGRGSAAGSLITYLLDITEVDPIKHSLIFERFLNPERVTMPDIDIDIQDSRRQEVVDYIFNKYGKNNVAHIITFQRYGARNSIRDAARVFNCPSPEIDSLSKLINAFKPLKYSYKTNSVFRARIDKNEINTKIYQIALTIEGLPKNIGTHAAGIVVANKNISDIIPTIEVNGLQQTQFSMNHLERFGLIKIDLLGLRNLTIIKSIQEQIFINNNKNLLIDKVSLDDESTFKLLSSANTNGVFQFESPGMKTTLRKVGVNRFEDIVAIVSLFRPGPMENIDLFAKRKNKTVQIEKIDDEIDRILEPTYGIIVYQEQIMEIVQKYANLSFGKADILRRAISKKKSDLMKTLEEQFIQGANSKGHNPETTKKVFDLILKFANYGFNRSHALSYALISYRLAFLKVRFPLEFYTAILNASISSKKMVETYIKEARSMGITIVPPNVNTSDLKVYNDGEKIFLPLIIIGGFGPKANEKIVMERKVNGDFLDFFDFYCRGKIAKLGDNNITSLIKANATNSFFDSKTLIEALPSATRYYKMIIKKINGQEQIIPELVKVIQKPKIVIQPDFNFSVENENKMFGFNIGLHKTQLYKSNNILSNIFNKTRLNDVVLEINKIRRVKQKNNNQAMAYVTISDITTSLEARIFSNELLEIDKELKTGVVIKCNISKRIWNDNEQFILERIRVFKELKNE